MNLIVTSMSTSAVFKKLEEECAKTSGDGDGNKKKDNTKTAQGKHAPKPKAKKRSQEETYQRRSQPKW